MKELLINEQIKAKEVRLFDQNGESVGVIPIKDALQKAEEVQLDLIAISPTAQPIVCKIMDYGKYRFELIKKEKEAKKKQKLIVIKEIKMSPSIEKHDIDIKINRAIKFLQDDCKLRICVQFKGREMAHRDIGYKILKAFMESISEYGVNDKAPMNEGNSLVINVEPKK
ncbi:MAG TPA: translation initiation factor IF-3 [Clostridiales bacterium]|nr:MAG: translation initiation factor IF-3 [Clostridiales bacterium GWD2_32_59]HAN10169.1 translation initiation factor IF-3 [Clostridiales bacterium]